MCCISASASPHCASSGWRGKRRPLAVWSETPARPQEMKIAIIGAGWAGCAAAVEATRLGHQVTLFEASRSAGGRARRVAATISGQPLSLDNGQHILIGGYSETLRLMTDP